jgi:hypothetical protein
MKRIAVIAIAITPEARAFWEGLVQGYTMKARWWEPLNAEKGKTSVLCELDTHDRNYEAFIALLEKHVSKYPDDIGAPGYEERFQAVLQSKGATWSLVRFEHVYTDDELRSFPLLQFSMARNPIGSHRSPHYGTTYDFANACSDCGTGAVQTSPLILPAAAFSRKGDLCAGPSSEKLVGHRIQNSLVDANATGMELRQALTYRDKKPTPWWQIIAGITMPKMSKQSRNLFRDSGLIQSTGPKRGCPVCERDMFAFEGKEPADFVYNADEVDVESLPDVVQTWECFGRSVLHDDPERSLVRGLAQPMILVKPKVFDIFRRLKVRGAYFEPVRIIE